MDLATVKLDPAKLERGSWWAIHRNADGSIGGEPVDAPGERPALLIVPAGLSYERALEEAREPFLQAIRDKKLSDADRLRIQGAAMAKAVLRGWQGLSLRGQDLPYSEDKAAELLCSAAWLAVHDFVFWAATVKAAAAAKEEEAAAGN